MTIKKIPNILHMIWVGDTSPPDYFYENIAKWKKLMPDWDFKIWTNDKISTEYIDPSYLGLLNIARNGAQKADLLKYYLVNKYGGYYVDADVIPIKSLDEINPAENELILCHDLEITWEYIAVGFFAASANNPVLQLILTLMHDVDFTDKEQNITTGPGVMGRAYFALRQIVRTFILPYWSFYRNRIGDEEVDCTTVKENKEGAFGSHFYASTWTDK